jgi:osmotically-inducible protein OsmY
MRNNRNQNYQQGWNENDEAYDSYRENQNRYQRYSNDRGWQNDDDRRNYNDQYVSRNYENRGNYSDNQNRKDYNRSFQNNSEDYGGSTWNPGYEDNYYNQNYRKGNYRSDYRNNRNTAERNWWDRTSDEVASWFGDDDAERRRRMDKLNGPHRGKGPKGYTRSDQRITEDVNEKLYHDPFVDASNIEVTISEGEVTLSGTVDSREAKRRAEDLAEEVSGVKDVTNQLKVSNTARYDTPDNMESDQHNGRKKSSWLS